MSWQERDYRSQEPESAWRRAMRRVFVEGEGFLSWALPLFTFRGIAVRLHLFFLIYVVTRLLWSMGSRHEFIFQVISLAVLFSLVLVHEFGHCFACRRVGGEANHILLWPLGGLATASPPHNWKASFVTTAGGPAVHVVLFPIFLVLLLAMGAPTGVVVFNPLTPGNVMRTAWFSEVNYLRVGVWLAYYTNLVLLGFNVLLPMFPMDGGRLMQELIWRKAGYRQSMMISTTTGMVIAGMLVMYSMASQGPGNSNSASTTLMMIGVFGGLYSWQERQRVKMMEDAYTPEYTGGGGGGGGAFGGGFGGNAGGGSATSVRAAERAAERARAEREKAAAKQAAAREEEIARQAELDRILAKIRDSGMGSLTKRERDSLDGESERLRKRSR